MEYRAEIKVREREMDSAGQGIRQRAGFEEQRGRNAMVINVPILP